MLAADIGATIENASRLGSNADVLLRALENRMALAGLELEEARQRAERAFLAALASGTLLLLTGTALNLLVAAIFWDTPNRVLALLILAGVQLLLAATLGWWSYAHWKRWEPLEHTRDQLAKDSACLREIFNRDH